MSEATKQNRVKRIQLDEHLLIDIFNWHRDPCHFVALPVSKQLPSDCEIVRVYHNYADRCFEAIVASREFEPVEPYTVPPMVDPPFIEWKTLVRVGNFKELYKAQDSVAKTPPN